MRGLAILTDFFLIAVGIAFQFMYDESMGDEPSDKVAAGVVGLIGLINVIGIMVS